MHCKYSDKCTGCSSWSTSYQTQINNKINSLKSLYEANHLKLDNDIQFISCGEHSLRERVDFTISYDETSKKYICGFYDKQKKLLDIDECLQLTPALQKVYQEFTSLNFTDLGLNIKKGSVRLRVYKNQKGCWLDLANTDIKSLLEEQRFLKKLIQLNYVIEIGQKKKRLSEVNGKLKLTEPKSELWFETLNSQKQNVALKCNISDFTQPSTLTAKSMVATVQEWLNHKPQINHIVEFGSGIGQFTLGLLGPSTQVTACEINEQACEQLLENAKDMRLQVLNKDFHKASLPLEQKADLILVNPARSGLQKFTEEVQKLNAEYLIYVSCFPETLCADLSKLQNYKIESTFIVDQFPQTQHYETIVFLKLAPYIVDKA